MPRSTRSDTPATSRMYAGFRTSPSRTPRRSVSTTTATRGSAKWDAVVEATELLHEERFHEALVELRSVLRSDPQNHYAFYFLGVALYESGELEAARDAYRACLRLAPQHLGARVGLTHVLRAL